MEDITEISLNIDSFSNLKDSNYEGLTPEHKLIIGLIKDSMLNVKHGHGNHYKDSISFLADTEGELKSWLDYLPEVVATEIRKRVNTFLKQQNKIQLGES